MAKFFEYTRYLFVVALVALIAISYHIQFNPPDAERSALYMQVFVLTVVTFLFTFKQGFIKSSFFRQKVIIVVFCFFFALAAFAIFDDSRYFSDLRDIIISLAALSIGFNTKLSKKQFMFLFLIYGVILVVFSSTSQIVANIGGLVIEDDYKIPSKNAIGAMLTAYVAASLPIIVSKDFKIFTRLFLCALSIVSFVILLTIRARASTMCFFMSFAVLVYVIYKNRHKGHQKAAKFLTITILLVIILFPLLSVISQPINEYVYSSLFQNVEGDVTTGRMDRNIVAIEFFINHPFLGRLEESANLLWVHNYLLRILTDYGVLFGMPLVILYFFYLARIIRRFLRLDMLSVSSIGYWSIIPLFLLSFVEPLFPFSPGTAVFFSFLLLGYSIQQTL